jgi:hypothetical protein
MTAKYSEETIQRVKDTLKRDYPDKTYKDIAVMLGVSSTFVGDIARPMKKAGQLSQRQPSAHMKGTKRGCTTFVIKRDPFTERPEDKPTEEQVLSREGRQKWHDLQEQREIEAMNKFYDYFS